MTLERFMPALKERCNKCGSLITGDVRYLKDKKKKIPLCRDCFGKRFGRKKEPDKNDVVNHDN